MGFLSEKEEEEEKEKEINRARKMMESIGMRDVYAKMSQLAIVRAIAGKIVEKEVATQLYHALVRMVKNGQNLKNLTNLKLHVMVDENGQKLLKAVLVMEKHMKENAI